VCDGFFTGLTVEPSPKFIFAKVTNPLDWSVNCTVNGAGRNWDCRKARRDRSGRVCDRDGMTCAAGLTTGTGDGQCRSEAAGAAVNVRRALRRTVGRAVTKSFQFQETGLPVEVSENCTVNGAWPLVGLAVKLAIGADATAVDDNRGAVGRANLVGGAGREA